MKLKLTLFLLVLASFGHAQNITIVSSGGASENSGWSLSSRIITASGTVSINASDIVSKLSSGSLTIQTNGQITISTSISWSNSNSLTLKSASNILLSPNANITTNGGSITFWSDSDASGQGAICIGNSTGGASITTSGGNITLSGGTSITTGYATSATGFLPWNGKPYSGISVFNTTLDAQGGNVVIRGALNNSLSSSVSGRAVILTASTIKTTSAGTVSVDGTAGNFAGSNPWGVVIETTSVVETASGNINLTGTGSIARTNARGIAIVGGTSIQSATGAIAIVDNTDSSSSNYTGTYIANSSKFGKSALASSSSNVTISADKIQFDASANNFTTSGNVTFEPYLTSFKNTFDTSGLVFGNQVAGLTIGKDSNTGFITIGTGTVLDIAGPIRFLNSSWININATTKTTGNIYFNCSEEVRQSAPIIANELHLLTGFYNLSNSSNNVSKIIGGSANTRIGSIAYRDADDLEIGSGSSSGIFSNSTILVETENGDIILAKSISTTATSADAIILNAGRPSAIGTTTGGDIIVSGTPSVTTGTNGIAKLFSGTNASSTGLTSLVGGSGNARYSYDESSTSFSPVLVNGNNYALYRYRDLTCEEILAITVQPTVVASEICKDAASETISFTSTASDYTIQWYSNSSNSYSGATLISGASSNSLSLPTTVVGTKYYFAKLTSNSVSCIVNTSIVSQRVLPILNSISSITGTSNLASDATTATYSILSVNGATSYVWSLPSGLTLTSQTGPSITVAVSSTYTSGSISVYALNSCGQTSVRSISVKKGTDPIGGVAFSVTGAPILCSNATATYTATTVTGGTYVWEVPNGITITSGQGSNAINVSSNGSFTSGIIKASYATAAYTLQASYTISGVALPSIISGPTNLCSVGTTTYSVTNVPGTSYVWSVPPGMTITSGTNSSSINVSISGSVSGNVSVRAQNSCGLSTPSTLLVKSTPIMGWMTGTTRVCGAVQTTVDANGTITNNNASDTYTYSVVAAVGVSYNWTVPSGATLVSGQGTNSITVRYNLASFDSGSITVQGTNSCGAGSARSLAVSAVTGEIAGPKSLCGLTTATYSVPADLGSVFTWSLPEGMSITNGQGTSSITVGITNPVKFNTTNQVSVQFTTGCGGTRTLKFSVNCADYTNLTSDYCGATGIDPYQSLYATAVTGATEYEFNIYNGATLITTINSTAPSFRFYGNTFTYGATYQVKVKVKKNGTYGIEGSSCTVTLGSLPTTKLQNTYCGSTGVNPWNWLYANAATGATSYRFNIYNGSTLVTAIDRTVPYFRFQGSTFAYGATYQVKIQVGQNGVYGAEGDSCSVTLESLPTIKLQNAYCGITGVSPWNWLYANAATGASSYRFNIYNGSTLVTFIDSTVPYFRFQGSTFVYGATYQVKIQVMQNGVYGTEGDSCSVTLENIPTTAIASSQCGSVLNNIDDKIYATSINGATMYKFQVYNDVDQTNLLAEIEKSVNFFRLTDFDYVDGTTYYVKVSIKHANGGADYGTAGALCSISTPGVTFSKQASMEKVETVAKMELQAVPNPFTDSFTITSISDYSNPIAYRIFDLSGKLIEMKEIAPEVLSVQKIGTNYPTGVYFVIVTQGPQSKTFRMIKQ